MVDQNGRVSTSDTEPESDAEASDSAMARLADSMREAGPAGYLFAAAVLIAAVVVVWSLSASDVVSTAVPEGEITEEAPSPPDLTGPESEQRSSEQPGSGTRDDIRALNQCFREHGIASRVTSATETELVLGVRPGSDPDTILEQPGLQDCIDEHLGGFDLEVSATEIAQGRSTEDGGSSDDRGDDDGADIQTTDGSTPPTQPTTHTTLS